MDEESRELNQEPAQRIFRVLAAIKCLDLREDRMSQKLEPSTSQVVNQ